MLNPKKSLTISSWRRAVTLQNQIQTNSQEIKSNYFDNFSIKVLVIYFPEIKNFIQASFILNNKKKKEKNRLKYNYPNFVAFSIS